jgi:hypothetical protein
MADRIAAALAQSRAQEREACAKVAEDTMLDADDTQYDDDHGYGGTAYNRACRSAAAAIRARTTGGE